MSLNKNGISVIICCYNSASRIAATLKHLSLQMIPENLPWEIIVVNNASTDDTAAKAKTEWLAYQRTEVSFQIIDQFVPGLSHARAKGVASSRYNYLIFCDDDNWLEENYIAQAFKLLNDWPDAAVIGGTGIPAPEVTPPHWFSIYSSYYATGPQSLQEGLINNSNPYVYGAGMVIRRSALLSLEDLNFQPIATDRLHHKLSSGGDVELCYAIRLNGGKIGYSESLKFLHFLPENRLTDQYLAELVYQFGCCDILHRPYYWLFHPELPERKKSWLWVLLISFHIFLLSLFKYWFTSGSANGVIDKVNLIHARGRLFTILKLNRRLKKDYLKLGLQFNCPAVQ